MLCKFFYSIGIEVRNFIIHHWELVYHQKMKMMIMRGSKGIFSYLFAHLLEKVFDPVATACSCIMSQLICFPICYRYLFYIICGQVFGSGKHLLLPPFLCCIDTSPDLLE